MEKRHVLNVNCFLCPCISPRRRHLRGTPHSIKAPFSPPPRLLHLGCSPLSPSLSLSLRVIAGRRSHELLQPAAATRRSPPATRLPPGGLPQGRLPAAGVPAPGLPSPGVPAPGLPSPGLPSPGLRAAAGVRAASPAEAEQRPLVP